MKTIHVCQGLMVSFASLLLTVPIGTANAQPVSYPLHTGDQWEYAAFVPNAPWQVAHDTVMPNGKTYRTIISQGYPSGDSSAYWQYHRQEGNQVFAFEKITQQEILFFDFDANAGDTITVYPLQSGVGRVILLAKDTDTLFGVARRHWVFLHDPSSYAIDEEMQLEVTDTLGVTGFYNMGGYGGTITGAVIDGRSYGTITEVPGEPSLTSISFQLDQPYPNPFNPQTTVGIQVNSGGFLLVEVYNVLGEKQATIWSGLRSQGTYVFKWDAGGFPAGVYLIRAETGEFQLTRKVLLLK